MPGADVRDTQFRSALSHTCMHACMHELVLCRISSSLYTFTVTVRLSQEEVMAVWIV